MPHGRNVQLDPVHTMRTLIHEVSIMFCAVLCLVCTASAAGAATLNKCVVNGAVTYQQAPCSTHQTRKLPTIDALNAEEKKRRAAAAAVAPAAAAKIAPAPLPVSGGFTCDGRKHCSQMKSCAEAKYFLAHCPGVEMDGNRDGTPCERQWCRP